MGSEESNYIKFKAILNINIKIQIGLNNNCIVCIILKLCSKYMELISIVKISIDNKSKHSESGTATNTAWQPVLVWSSS